MILTPLVDDDPISLADWLELTAFFAAGSKARLDAIENALEISQDEEAQDLAVADLDEENLAAQLTDEIGRRAMILGDTYPFKISENGEQLTYLGAEGFGELVYLICLIISNSWKDGKLAAPLRLTPQEEVAARAIFEIVSTVAALGRTGGPAFLIGTNRAGAQALLDRLAHICVVVGEGIARDVPADAAPPSANDDGIDLIAVEREPDGPPARAFLFGQSASGRNFDTKSISNLIKGFLDIWFDTQPANHEAAVFVPAVLAATKLRYWNNRLGQMIHRPRLAHYARAGFILFEQEPGLLHFVDDVEAPRRWFEAYEQRARPAAVA